MQPKKKVERPKTLGGSDAIRIMEGDWHTLWLEKTGRQEPANLDRVLPVQIGIVTEGLNKLWFAQETGHKLLSASNQHDFTDGFRHASLDGLVNVSDKICVLECKHTNANNTLENVIRKYMPQLQHYMQVAMMDRAYLSVIFGNMRYEWCEITYDNDYIKMLYEMEDTFWKQHILTDKEPENIKAEKIVHNYTDNIKVNEMIRIDMEKNNEFVANAHTWRETKIPYDQHRAVGKVLKELIPANCRLAEGGGIKISRTKAGHLTIKENKGG
ncbi:MAG: hypothetical protein CMB24_06180 [Euryarchaeota archaeon]|nr:hypothetical protein [Euryarchaeota archaeon]|tara:strand:+ start:3704 stop:4513 length:810 start_codon:yes stop_codon:yes gene_type:complete